MLGQSFGGVAFSVAQGLLGDTFGFGPSNGLSRLQVEPMERNDAFRCVLMGAGDSSELPHSKGTTMALSGPAPLHGRHRDKNGEISKKHGNTLVGTLRKTYGKHFAEGCGDHEKLADVLYKLDEPSLRQLVLDTPKAGSPQEAQ